MSVKLYSPDGKTSVNCHPTQVENMKRSGWKEKPKPKKVKAQTETVEG